MWSIGNTALPAPAAFRVSAAEKCGVRQYNAQGQLCMDGVREKRVLEVTYRHLTGTELAALAALMPSGAFFSLTYPDPFSGPRTASFRVTARRAAVLRAVNGTEWTDIALTLEER